MIDDDDGRMTRSDPAPPVTAKTKSKASKQMPAAPPDHIWVGAAGAWVPQAWPAMYPLVGQLVSEDLSWRVGVLQWQSLRPSRFRFSARACWRKQGTALERKRERLRETARELGLTPAPVARAPRRSTRFGFRAGR